VTADGEVVLDHDGLVAGPRWRRRRSIGELRHGGLPSHIPTLRELLETCGTGYHLSLDLKDAGAGAAVIDVVRSVDPAMLPRVWLCHPDVPTVASLRSLDPTVKLVDSTRLDRIKEGPERRAAALSAAGIDAINMHYRDWTGGLTTLFHRFELLTLAWDVQQRDQLHNVIRMGIDGVFSDWVDRMMDALTEQSGAG
jgi:glycerophosphoryl diester phosphodiesterase